MRGAMIRDVIDDDVRRLIGMVVSLGNGCLVPVALDHRRAIGRHQGHCQRKGSNPE